ncbi:hypothetical protein F2P56_030798 [Juglans regia]|uniref:Uncharacterized protein LOC108993992 n=2 Tax=Juglans regia TaxID=51240 RepID=A0A2I4EYY6_JUGRE|nr:uncharacterized protein LOC108993992 [Juglans regia]KAF5450444.1 hypothetical protein F2P56_030798 [Juglans regia]
MVDNGSSTDIHFWDVFAKMGFDPSRLQPSPTPLEGFSRDVVQPLGAITLPVTARKGAHTTTKMTNFLVVRAPSSYKAILGRPTLNSIEDVISTYHLNIKFPTKVGVGEVQGEQAPTQECYVQEIKTGRKDVRTLENQNQGEVPPLQPVLLDCDVEAQDEENLQQVEANEPLELVTLHPE